MNKTNITKNFFSGTSNWEWLNTKSAVKPPLLHFISVITHMAKDEEEEKRKLLWETLKQLNLVDDSSSYWKGFLKETENFDLLGKLLTMIAKSENIEFYSPIVENTTIQVSVEHLHALFNVDIQIFNPNDEDSENEFGFKIVLVEDPSTYNERLWHNLRFDMEKSDSWNPTNLENWHSRINKILNDVATEFDIQDKALIELIKSAPESVYTEYYSSDYFEFKIPSIEGVVRMTLVDGNGDVFDEETDEDSLMNVLVTLEDEADDLENSKNISVENNIIDNTPSEEFTINAILAKLKINNDMVIEIDINHINRFMGLYGYLSSFEDCWDWDWVKTQDLQDDFNTSDWVLFYTLRLDFHGHNEEDNDDLIKWMYKLLNERCVSIANKIETIEILEYNLDQL